MFTLPDNDAFDFRGKLILIRFRAKFGDDDNVVTAGGQPVCQVGRDTFRPSAAQAIDEYGEKFPVPLQCCATLLRALKDTSRKSDR